MQRASDAARTDGQADQVNVAILPRIFGNLPARCASQPVQAVFILHQRTPPVNPLGAIHGFSKVLAQHPLSSLRWPQGRLWTGLARDSHRVE